MDGWIQRGAAHTNKERLEEGDRMKVQFGITLIEQKNNIKSEILSIELKLSRLWDEIDELEKHKGILENELINWKD